MQSDKGIIRQMTEKEMKDMNGTLVQQWEKLEVENTPRLVPVKEEHHDKSRGNYFIKPAEKCPCGSGKQYRHCHLKKMSKGQLKRYFKRISR